MVPYHDNYTDVKSTSTKSQPQMINNSIWKALWRHDVFETPKANNTLHM